MWKSPAKLEKIIKNNPHFLRWKKHTKNVDNVDNYLERRFSPIKYTSPAPIVINKSLFIRFFSKYC